MGSGQEITGRGTTRGLSYTHYFHPAGAYRSTLAVGLDDKLFRAPVVGGIVLPTGDVRSRPASLEYAGRYDNDAFSLNGAISYARNIAGGRNNDTASYAANRFGADEQWEVMRTQMTMIMRLKGGWMVNATARGQFTREPLIAGEQFGVGGVASVRGFDERSVTGDRGLSLSFELWTPELAKDLRLLAFLDSARISRIQAVAGTGTSESIMSVGVGLRYGLSRTGSFSLDYGVVTQGSSLPLVNRGASVLHGSLLLQF